MASATLHIKDAYYFEVPKIWLPSQRTGKAEFPDVWVRLDPEYQLWEAERLHKILAREMANVPSWPELRNDYLAWRSDHANFGKPLDVMLEEIYAHQQAAYREWLGGDGHQGSSFAEFLTATHAPQAWFSRQFENPQVKRMWQAAKAQAEGVAEYKQLPGEWSAQKIGAYNRHLSGKILIPQPFGGRLRNLYEPESGFCLSKFMVIEMAVALVLIATFVWLSRKFSAGGPPRGRCWNFLEVFLIYFRDHVARPVIGHDGDKFVPLLWTIFMFVLVCNLCGALPWVGAPTGAFGATSGLAAVTVGCGIFFGTMKFGVVGFWTNMVPHMKLPPVLDSVIKLMLLLIEILGFFIKHAVLAIRLLANMVAGHLVLLGIMSLAFGATAAVSFADAPHWQWWLTASISVVASALFSCLELFVAFLQAYIFTFLSALFISAAIHHH
jgi:F-type H+-transporting ATPase subunit a